jgi:hypothetical protein
VNHEEGGTECKIEQLQTISEVKIKAETPPKRANTNDFPGEAQPL